MKRNSIVARRVRAPAQGLEIGKINPLNLFSINLDPASYQKVHLIQLKFKTDGIILTWKCPVDHVRLDIVHNFVVVRFCL